MAQTIKLKRSATQNAVPSTSSLALGEIAINTYDGKLFIKKDVSGTESIVTIGEVGANSIGPTELASTAVTAGSYGSTSAIPVITIDADGRITSASTATISGLSANSVTSTEIAANAVGISELNVTDGTDGQVLTTDGNGTLTFEDQSGGAASATAFSTNIANGDGSTAAFTLSESPSSESKIIAFINGVFQNQDAYTISGTTITFDTAPISGTNNVVVYVIGDVYSGESVLISNFSGNGTTTAFTLANNPGNENNTQVYIDGVYQQKTTYNVSGTTLTFSSAPPTGTNNIEVVMLTSTTVNTPAAGSVVTASMADDSVTGAKLVSSAVTTAKIADGNVTTAKIADANVTTAKIADDAVTIGKIADAALVIESEGIGSNDNDTTLPTSAAVKDYVDTQVAGKDALSELSGDTDDVTEGSTNLYFTNARADARITNALKDEDNMASNSATHIPSQQSVKAYVDAQTTDETAEGSTNLYYTDARVGTYISGNRNYGNITTTGYLAGPSTFTIDPAGVGNNTGTLVIAGNLQVDGTTTTINSTTLTVDDKLVTLASGSANAGAANGAGIEVDISGVTNPSILYDGTNDEWDFNKNVNVTGNVTAQSGGLTVGVSDTTAGVITVHGGATGNTEGGEIRLQTSADHDSTYEYYRLDVVEDDFRIGRAGTTDLTLDSSGNATFAGNISSGRITTSDGIADTGQAGSATIFNESGSTADFRIESDSKPYMFFLDGGLNRIGINTGTPSHTLHILNEVSSDTIDETNGLVKMQSSGGNGMIFGTIASSPYTSYIQSAYVQDTSIAQYNLALNPIGGNVGIGTDSPGDKLTIEGAGAQVLSIYSSDTGSQSSAKTFINLYGENTAAEKKLQAQIASAPGHNASSAGELHFSTNNSSSAITRRMTIREDGNVGIGTDAPTEKLHIFNSSASWNQYANIRMSTENDSYAAEIGFHRGTSDDTDRGLFLSGDGTNQQVKILHGGNVGIGETSPDTTLHLKSAGATSIAIESTTNAQNLDLLFYNNAGSTQGYIRYAEGPGDFYFVPQNGGGATLKLDWTGFMAYGDEPSGDPPPNTASFRMNSSSTTGGPSTGGSTGGNTYYPVVIGGGTHLAGRAFGIGLDPEGYGYRNKIGIVVEGDGAGYSKGDLHLLFNNASDGQNAQISDAKFTFLREGYLGIGTRSPQRKLHIIGADGSSGLTEGNSRCALFLDNAGATYVNIASGNTSNGAIFFSDPNANNAGALLYEHSTNSIKLFKNGVETLKLSGQTNVAYTADGLFNANARPHTIQSTTGGAFVLGYRDHGSGLYQGAMGLSYDSIDGLGNTAYRDAIVLKETSNGGQEHFRVSGNGNVTNTNNSYGQISDERLKTDIVDASSQWDDIKAVRVRKFKFGTAPEGHDFLQIGVISQELEASGMGGLIEESDPDDSQLAFNPELVGQQVKTVKYSVLYMKAIKALQEAMTRIEQLETRVTELEG